MVRGERPTGTVTFVFTDIEGSTAMLDRLGEDYGDLLFAHHALLRDVWSGHGGVEVSTEGDAFFVAFDSASRAVAATAAAQAAIAGHRWPRNEQLKVRMGVHTGEPRVREGDYWGADVHYAARVASAARGGQVLVSAATAALASEAELSSLGRHRLKDFPVPRELFALGPGPHPAPKTLDPLRTNLPSAPALLIGRERELDEVERLLLGTARLVTVVGRGGEGKTRLALAVADRLLDKLRDGAFLVELAELTAAEDVPGAIAAVIGTSAGLLRGTLAGRELLLVLDNFEHVLEAASGIAELLAAAPDLRVLVTSQAPLRLADEHRYALAGLTEESAIALLLAHAERASHRIDTDESTADGVAALCRELDGSPLAIELAAARLALLSPEELAERLQRSPDALGTGGRGLPKRQRGLRAAMQRSYDLLAPDAARLFRCLGHFSGEATLERIEQVCGADIDDVLESLAQLVELSLVRRTRGGRFEVASALRTFSRELLSESAQRELLCRRHTEAIVEEWLPIAIERPMISYRRKRVALAAEQADLTMLLDWSASGDVELFSRLVASVFDALGEDAARERWHEPLQEAAAKGPATGAVRTKVRIAAAMAARAQGEQLHLLDIALSSDTDDSTEFAGWLFGTCAVLDAMQRPSTDWRPKASLAVAKLRASEAAEIRDLATIVDAYLLLLEDRFDEAASAFEAAIERDGQTWAAQTPVYMVGDCHLFAGAFQAAVSAYGRGLIDAHEKSSRIDMGFQAEGIVAALIDLGRHEDALEALGASDSLTGEHILPRELDTFWASVMSDRIASARAALGEQRADRAYARGRERAVDDVMELLLSFAPAGVQSA